MFRWQLRRRILKKVVWRVKTQCFDGSFDVEFWHHCSLTKLWYHAKNLIYCHVMQCKFIRVNTVIHAGPSGRAEIHNETPLSRLTHIPNHPKTANLKKRKRRRGKRASNPPKGHLRRQVLINYWGVLISWCFVPLGGLRDYKWILVEHQSEAHSKQTPRAKDLDNASTPGQNAPPSMDWLQKLEEAGLKGGEKQDHT